MGEREGGESSRGGSSAPSPPGTRGPQPATQNPQPFVAFLRGLRAVRRFRPEAVPAAALADILEVARWSGSSMNRQPWAFVVVRDRATLDALAAISRWARHLAAAPLAIALVTDGGDPVDETYDEGRLAERIMLAARAHGLGACIGWFSDAGDDVKAKALLGVPPERTLRTVVSIGYPAPDAGQTRRRPVMPRKPPADLVHVERWGAGETG